MTGGHVIRTTWRFTSTDLLDLTSMAYARNAKRLPPDGPASDQLRMAGADRRR